MDLYGDDEPNLLFADGFDEAIAGTIWDGERTREAVEYFDFNIMGSHMGEYTPLYLET